VLVHLVGGPERWAGKSRRYDIDDSEMLTVTEPGAVYVAAKPRQTIPTIDGDAVLFVCIGVAIPALP